MITKHLRALACVLAMMALLSACGKLKLLEESAYEVNTLDSVTMAVNGVSADGAAYTIRNGGEEDLTFGMDFGVQAEKNGVWYDIEHEPMSVIAIAAVLEAGAEGTYTCSWENGYGALSAGHYRIVKSVSAGGDGQSHWLAAEFTIE